MRELVVDNFAGGGGASSGIEQALGRAVDFAINHDAEAVAMHRANHPTTRHLITNVWDVDPRKLAAGRPVGLGWFSPDCTFHSKARGGKPFRDRDTARRRRGLAGLIPRWAATSAAPRVIMLENVEEFADWGPLLPDGKICPRRRGMLFRRWHRQLENLGYRIDMRELRACDYGAPTSRKRLFVVARRDGGEIVFPEPTHGPPGLMPYRAAADCIDWSIPCPSIFERSRPLVEATMRRIARGVMRYVVNSPEPFIVPASNMAGAQNHALVAAFLARHYGGHENDGSSMRTPMHTITTRDHHALVCAFLVAYYGNEKDGISLAEPMRTVVTKDRFALIVVRGEPYYIADIGMRMLAPHELFAAQGFRPDYITDHGIDESGDVLPLSGRARVRLCGNSVSPPAAEALVKANYAEQRIEA